MFHFIIFQTDCHLQRARTGVVIIWIARHQYRWFEGKHWVPQVQCNQSANCLVSLENIHFCSILWDVDIFRFWRALRSFDQTDRAKFLQFVTGSSKVPLQVSFGLSLLRHFTTFCFLGIFCFGGNEWCSKVSNSSRWQVYRQVKF